MPRRLLSDNGTTRLYEVTDQSGRVIGTDEETIPTAEQVNADTIRAQAANALFTNRTFIARGTTNTAVQVRDETVALARQMNGVIRLLLNQLDGTD